jgi:Na+-transporting NADH:ubiquinone oxidoreductase subunit B
MRFLREFLDKQESLFTGKGKLAKFYPVYEAIDTFLYTPGETTKGSVHLRDAMDLKRAMITVAVALTPCIIMACWNTGYQALQALTTLGLDQVTGVRGQIFHAVGFGVTPQNPLAAAFLGLLYFLPVFLVTNIVGGICEAVFSIVRKHEINEGFLVTGLLFPLTLPPTIPLWQVAIGIAFGVIFAKEIFGGTGKNFLNVALASRAFLFFAYPAQISGNEVWTAVDGYSGATILSSVVSGGMEAVNYTWWQAFLGAIPGSMGETSTLACLLGAVILIVSGIGSWKIMLSMVLSTCLFATLANTFLGDAGHFYIMPAYWHLVVGGFAFGCVFMATDPVTACMTDLGRWFYGFLIGFMVILVRVVNPAFPEGVMLAILFANVFAPLIDWFVVNKNVRRRRVRYEQR